MKAFASVIIPAYNRREAVVACLNSVLNQGYPKNKYEVIVADDGSKDDTEKAIKKIAAKNKNVRYFKQQNQGPGGARNLGIKKARGEIILLIDQDCTAEKNWIKEHLKVYINERIGGTGGDIRPPKTGSVIERYGNSLFGSEKNPDKLGEGGLIKTGPITCNASYRKKVLLEIGGFDAELRTYYEDADLNIRIAQKGHLFKYVPNAKITHHHRMTFRELIRQHYDQGIGGALLGKKHGDVISIPKEAGFGFLKIVFLFLAIPVRLLKVPLKEDKKLALVTPFLDIITNSVRVYAKTSTYFKMKINKEEKISDIIARRKNYLRIESNTRIQR